MVTEHKTKTGELDSKQIRKKDSVDRTKWERTHEIFYHGHDIK